MREKRTGQHSASTAQQITLMAVYIILGVLVIGASFYTGWLTGQNQVLMEKLAQDVALAPNAPAPSVPSAPAPEAPRLGTKTDIEKGRYVMGNQNAPVEVIEFGDYQCPFCKRFFDQTEQQLIDTYVTTGKVKFSVRHFPLNFHAQAQKAAEATECAGKQGKFWEMHKLLYQNSQSDGTGLNIADLKKYAADLKLDTAKFNTCLDNGETAALVQKDFQDGQAAGVSGTPSFYINGKQVVGAQPFSSFQAAIEAELSS